ncbi:hypothetical protein B0G57_12917 [Trinickia symbiotica]|nr:hypothetical protein B0G57_12917 [Trinickia symbiotica]
MRVGQAQSRSGQLSRPAVASSDKHGRGELLAVPRGRGAGVPTRVRPFFLGVAPASPQTLSRFSTRGPTIATSAAHNATTESPIVRFVTWATPPIMTGPNSNPQ